MGVIILDTDEYSAKQSLKHLYKLENRGVKLGTEEDYVKLHMSLILKECDGQWDDHIADVYIENLRHSI